MQGSWSFDPQACVVRAAAHTDRGAVRKVNEDRPLVGLGVFGVADGMGGPGGGDIAAHTALEAFSTALRAGGGIRHATNAAHNAVLRAAQRPAGVVGMGTTLSIGAVGWIGSSPTLALAHVGDSRAYRSHRCGHIARLTRDQSVVQDLVDGGVISEPEARHHPRRNVVTSAIGSESFEPALMFVPARSGDRLLFCSDGVHGVLDDTTIEALLARPSSPRQLALGLVAAALAEGTRDNLTAVVVDVLTHRRRPTYRQFGALSAAN